MSELNTIITGIENEAAKIPAIAAAVEARITAVFSRVNSLEKSVVGEALVKIMPQLAAIEAALAPPVYLDRQTLGGIVSHAWIEGPIATYEAIDTHTAAALVPINMLLP